MTLKGVLFGFYVFVILSSYLLGIVYLIWPRIMPWHLAALGMAWDDLSEQVQVLMLAFLKLGGAGAFAVAVTLTILVLIPFRRDDGWTYWAIPAIGLTYWLPVLYAGLTVQLFTPASPPWLLNFLCCLVLILACVLTPFVKRPDTARR